MSCPLFGNAAKEPVDSNVFSVPALSSAKPISCSSFDVFW